MRASRLVSLLLFLQARGLMTAQDLSAALEVPVRTVYRDVESLGALAELRRLRSSETYRTLSAVIRCCGCCFVTVIWWWRVR